MYILFYFRVCVMYDNDIRYTIIYVLYGYTRLQSQCTYVRTAHRTEHCAQCKSSSKHSRVTCCAIGRFSMNECVTCARHSDVEAPTVWALLHSNVGPTQCVNLQTTRWCSCGKRVGNVWKTPNGPAQSPLATSQTFSQFRSEFTIILFYSIE